MLRQVLWYENRLTDALIDEILDLEMDAGLAAAVTEQTPYEELVKSCKPVCTERSNLHGDGEESYKRNNHTRRGEQHSQLCFCVLDEPRGGRWAHVLCDPEHAC